MHSKRRWGLVLLLATVFLLSSTALVSAQTFDVFLPAISGAPQHTPVTAQAAPLTSNEELGKLIFDDMNLSIGKNQSCASCHGPAAGWTGPESVTNATTVVYEGSIPGAFGDRKPPSAAYATLSPIFYQDKKGAFVGGNFWDGRATGKILDNPAADQAQGPFLNPKEQALPDSACVVYLVCMGGYAGDFKAVWGADRCEIAWPADVVEVCATEQTEDKTVVLGLSDADRAKSDANYDSIARSIAEYEDSPEVNAFSSKYDLTSKLTKEEQRGFALFQGKGNCQRCHPSTGQQPLFTDFTYDNLGIPVNPENPAYLASLDSPDGPFADPGLGGFLKIAGYSEQVYLAELGKFKVPTLRNVDLRPSADFVKAFGHNGYFKSLDRIVHFYNTRDVLPPCPLDSNGLPYTDAMAAAHDIDGCWPAPEVAANVNTAELGNLGLTPAEEAAIVAYLKTLSDLAPAQ
jgi:cytochrome c peroxidase